MKQKNVNMNNKMIKTIYCNTETYKKNEKKKQKKTKTKA